MSISLPGKQFTHPDDPINHLHVIEADLLKKISSRDKDPPVVYQGCEPRPEGYEGQSEGTSDRDQDDESQHDLSDWRTGDRTKSASKSSKTVDLSKKEGAREHTILSSHDETLSHATTKVTAGKSSRSESSPYGNWIEVNPPKTLQSDSKKQSHDTNVAVRNKSNPKGERRHLQGQVMAISVDDIKSHRLTVDEIRQLDRFKNYSIGTPSKVGFTYML